MKDANDLCLRNEAIEYSLEELIDSITADDLCDVQDGTFTKVYEEYGLEAAERFISNITDSSKMFELHDYLEQHEMDRATFLKAGEESSSIAFEVCFNYWYRANNLLNLKYVEEEFFRYTAQEIQLGEKLEDTFMCYSCIIETHSLEGVLMIWQPSLIKKYGLEAIIPYFLEKFAEEDFLDPFYSDIDDCSSYIGDMLSIFPEYTDRDEVFTIMENLLFRDLIEDVQDLYDLIQKNNCAPIMHMILARFTEGDIWEQLVYGNDTYDTYFIERLCQIQELVKGTNGLIDFLTSLVPILSANRDSEVAEDIIDNLYQIDLPDECTVLTDFINEYYGEDDE